jgi:DNA-binding response OmpR family regulator
MHLEFPMPRILVIDDQSDVRAMIAIVLRVKHFEVVEAQSAAAGLRAFEESPFDLAIVDVFLQDACGFDVISRMRDIVPDLPVVAISGMTTTLDAAPQSAELLNVVCLQKPFRPNDLTAAIDEARRRVQQGGERVSIARVG